MKNYEIMLKNHIISSNFKLVRINNHHFDLVKVSNLDIEKLIQDIEKLILDLNYLNKKSDFSSIKRRMMLFFSKHPYLIGLPLDTIFESTIFLGQLRKQNRFQILNSEYKEIDTENLISIAFEKGIDKNNGFERLLDYICFISRDFSSDEITGISFGLNLRYNFTNESFNGKALGQFTVDQNELNNEKIKELKESLRELTDKVYIIDDNDLEKWFTDLPINYQISILSLDESLTENSDELIELIRSYVINEEKINFQNYAKSFKKI
jgi:hypothetical protein